VTLSDGERLTAERLALATPPRTTARLLAGVLPGAVGGIAEIGEASVDSLGLVVRAEQVAAVPYATFLIPRGDIFHSVVTRDVVPDPIWRGFVFHFQPDHTEADRLARITALLGVARADLADAQQRHTVLPSPVLGHKDVVAGLDAQLATQPRLAVTGNWFAGLAIEDCILRSRAEWQRVGGSPTVAP